MYVLQTFIVRRLIRTHFCDIMICTALLQNIRKRNRASNTFIIYTKRAMRRGRKGVKIKPLKTMMECHVDRLDIWFPVARQPAVTFIPHAYNIMYLQVPCTAHIMQLLLTIIIYYRRCRSRGRKRVRNARNLTTGWAGEGEGEEVKLARELLFFSSPTCTSPQTVAKYDILLRGLRICERFYRCMVLRRRRAKSHTTNWVYGTRTV